MALEETHLKDEYPERADILKTLPLNPLPIIPPGTLDQTSLDGDEPTRISVAVIDKVNNALAADDFEALKRCFLSEQAYWKDQVALTYHFRTFKGPEVVTANLLKTKQLRGLSEGLELEGVPQFVPATPVLQWIDCTFSFKTTSPAATATGRLLLLPVVDNGTTDLDNLNEITTEVAIIGGGNSGAILSARLKTLGVDSVIIERNANPGDNWALRYDSLKFHVPTSLCDMPYLPYPPHLHTPHFLTRTDLATHLALFTKTFHLPLLLSTTVTHTTYHPSQKSYTLHLTTPHGPRLLHTRHLVLATGIASQKPFLPLSSSPSSGPIYRGLSLHSSTYQSPSASFPPTLSSLAIVGSANTAFDILQDVTAHMPNNLKITMVVRSPTYVVPVSYPFDPRGLGVYEVLPVDKADEKMMTMPTWTVGHLVGGLFRLLSEQEGDRYERLRDVGFPVLDGRDDGVNLLWNLLERGGGHYVEVGGTRVLEEGRADVVRGEVVGWEEGGVRLGDGRVVEAEAVVWATGFADADVGGVVEEVLGGGKEEEEEVEVEEEGVLGPREIAERVEGTWGVDAEGEIRGMWKRHGGLDNFWVMGGDTSRQRWFSRLLALQIKAELEGVLPEAYRETVSS